MSCPNPNLYDILSYENIRVKIKWKPTNQYIQYDPIKKRYVLGNTPAIFNIMSAVGIVEVTEVGRVGNLASSVPMSGCTDSKCTNNETYLILNEKQNSQSSAWFVCNNSANVPCGTPTNPTYPRSVGVFQEQCQRFFTVQNGSILLSKDMNDKDRYNWSMEAGESIPSVLTYGTQYSIQRNYSRFLKGQWMGVDAKGHVTLISQPLGHAPEFSLVTFTSGQTSKSEGNVISSGDLVKVNNWTITSNGVVENAGFGSLFKIMDMQNKNTGNLREGMSVSFQGVLNPQIEGVTINSSNVLTMGGGYDGFVIYSKGGTLSPSPSNPPSKITPSGESSDKLVRWMIIASSVLFFIIVIVAYFTRKRRGLSSKRVVEMVRVVPKS
jgi:hypothetical protein